MNTAYERIVDALQANGRLVKPTGVDKASAQCPAHDDQNPSLSIFPRKDGKGVVVKCFAGCDLPNILDAIGMTLRDVYDDAGMRGALKPNRDYRYPNGAVKQRRTPPNGAKKLYWQKPGTSDGSLFMADKIPADCPLVFLVEGEKAALVIWEMGAVAVATGGTGRDMSPLRGIDVRAVVDRDYAGLQWAARQKKALDGVAASLTFARCAVDIPKADVVEHVAAGFTLSQLEEFDPFSTSYGDEPVQQRRDDEIPWPTEPPDEQQRGGEPDADAEPDSGLAFIDGATFVLDIPPTIPALWGDGDDVLWAEGESLMIAGPMGLGKTTLEGLLIRAQLVGGDVLGLPVTKRSGVILVLAMDRPSQIARSMHRQFSEDERELLAERVKVWRGPPPADLARRPELLAKIAEAAGAETVYLDSVKDAAIGLSDDEVGAGYNRARQILLEAGVQLAESHHTVKRGAGGGPPASVADVYGSAWITNGCGSLVLLSGEPGDPIVGFRHLRAPANEVGPWRLLHDQASGLLSVEHAKDFVELAAACGVTGLNAKHAAAVLYECSEPTRPQVEKARRKLDQLVTAGLLTRVEGSKGGGAERNPTSWFPV